jgi:hypothetical protein
MSSIDSALLFWAIALGSLSTDTILLALLYRMDRHRQQIQQELATVQQQAAVIQRSAFYLEAMARAARGDVEEMAEEEDADLFVKR